MDGKKKFDKVRYNNTYNKNAYDRVNLILPKGKKDVIHAHADSRGESVNALINRAIDELLEREGAAQVITDTEGDNTQGDKSGSSGDGNNPNTVRCAISYTDDSDDNKWEPWQEKSDEDRLPF